MLIDDKRTLETALAGRFGGVRETNVGGAVALFIVTNLSNDIRGEADARFATRFGAEQ